MDKTELKALAGRMVEAVRSAIATSEAATNSRLDQLQARLDKQEREIAELLRAKGR